MKPTPTVPPLVAGITARYLELVDAAFPGRVEALYLIGSVAYGDFHDHTSDVDFVAVGTFGVEDLPALAEVHAAVQVGFRRPWFDGVYPTWEALETDPVALDRMPEAHEGKVTLGRPSAIEWATFAQAPVVVRGDPAPAVWFDFEGVRAYSRRNVEEYWTQRWLAGQHSTRPVAALSLSDWGVAWGVLGVARMHTSMVTGLITSKSGGGEHALAAFPDSWHRIVHEALRIRRSEGRKSLYRSPLRRRREALAFQEFVIDEIRRQWP